MDLLTARREARPGAERMSLAPLRRERATIERVRSGLPLAPNEERYVLDAVMSPEVYGNPWTVRIRGPFDVPRFKAAIRAACQRHEGRRVGYEHAGDGRFTKYIEGDARFGFVELPMPGASEDQIREAVEDWYFPRVDLTPMTLTRCLLIRLGPEEYVFGNSLHHATSDGETKDAFIAEIFDRYSGKTDFPPSPSFSDLWTGDWSGSEAYRAAEAFWNEKLSGLGAIGALPRDGAGDPTAISRPAVVRLSPEQVARAKAAAGQVGVSDFTFFYAVALVQLSRLTGEARVGTTFQSGGRRSVPGAAGVHGCFSNGLILATAVDETQTIASLAARLRVDIREALAHEQVPYHHVIRNTGVSPRFGINWFPEQPTIKAAGLELSQPDMTYGRYEYDLSYRFVRKADGALDLIIFFKEADYSRARVEAVAAQFAALLDACARDVEAPIASVKSADLAPPGVLPDPAVPLAAGGEALIHDAFLGRARETPNAAALISGSRTCTYGQLERASAAIAAALARADIGPGDRVAILAERGPDLVAAMLGVARAGGVFAVLDAAYPEPRLQALAALCAPLAVVTAGSEGLGGLARRLAGGRAVIDARQAWTERDASPPETARPAASDPAYILFTSGSTGRPKGVACSHQPLTQFVRWQAETFGLGAADRFTMVSGLSHDPLLRDVFTPLSLGAAVVIPDPELLTDPAALAPWLKQVRASVIHLTPALGEVLHAGERRVRSLPSLRQVFWGGDLLRPRLVADIARLAPAARQVNFYGCTETPQAVGWFDCANGAEGRVIPVGRGAAEAQLFVVDAARRPVGIGELGEIAVRSNHLSLGYVKDGRILEPGDRGQDGGAGVYYTGDRGFHLPGGEVVLLGRADDQVKVRGYRVELAEVTAALAACPGVAEAVALASDAPEPAIVAFVTPSEDTPPDEPELMHRLAQRLPPYMLPRSIQVLDSLPLMPNGKVDRAALRARSAETPKPAGGAAPANATERALIQRWSSVLIGADVTRQSTFASLGGDSLSYVQCFLATEEVLGEAPWGWHLMTVADLAAQRRTARRGWSTVDSPIVLRAAALMMVVLGHFSILDYGGGATGALMVVSGFMFGGLVLQDAFAKRSAAPALRVVLNMLAPVFLLSLLVWLFRSYGKPAELYILMLTADLQDYSVGGRAQDLYLWYVHALLHIMMMVYLALAAVQVAGWFDVGRRRFLAGVFALGCLGRFVLPALIDPGFYDPDADHTATIYLLPTSHLATLALGGLIATASGLRERLMLVPVIVAYTLLSGWLFGWSQLVFLGGGSLLLLALPRISLPRFAAPAVLALAGASLWIYMTHMMIQDALQRVLPQALPYGGVAIALAVGIGMWTAWVRGGAWLAGRFLRRPAAVAADAAV